MDIFTIEEAAKALGVTVQTVKNYVKRQQLIPVRYVGRSPVFNQAALDACKGLPRHGGGRPKKPRDDNGQPT